MCEIVTNLKRGDEVLLNPDQIQEIIDAHKCIIAYCYIIHDQDTYTEEDEAKNPDHKAGTLKPSHVHILLKFSQPQHADNIAKWFGLAPNFVCKIHGTWADACAYQIHWNDLSKHQYNMNLVTSSFPYDEFLLEFEQSGGKPKSEQAIVKEYAEKILSGEIREHNKTLEIDNWLLVKYATTFDRAFKVRSEYLQATHKTRHTQVIYITGKSGCGKTTLAKMIADQKKLDYFISSGSNDIMDGYAQEPVLIVDDIRPSVLGLSDLLKMLDPHTATSVKSRYKNKYLNAELVILTTVLDIDTFYNNVFAEHDEPIVQLKRRCQTLIEMDRENIYVSVWDSKIMRYTPSVAYKNTILKAYISAEKKNTEDVTNLVSTLMPFLEPDEGEVTEDGLFTLKKVQKSHVPTQEATGGGPPPISDSDFAKLMPNQVTPDPERSK